MSASSSSTTATGETSQWNATTTRTTDPADFLSLLDRAGFTPTERSGANLLWRLWHPLSLLGGDRLARVADRLTLLDGRMFSSANLFVVARAR